MKKTFLMLLLIVCGTLTASAQKYALIDMDYILKHIPAYNIANEQLDQMSQKWQTEVETLAAEAERMYKDYQKDQSYLSAAQKTAREEAIMAKEKAVQDLRLKYFGPEGALYQQRNSLVGNIQDNIYEAVKEIATRNNFAMVIDRASAESIIFASPKIDISKEVLKKLGY